MPEENRGWRKLQEGQGGFPGPTTGALLTVTRFMYEDVWFWNTVYCGTLFAWENSVIHSIHIFTNICSYVLGFLWVFHWPANCPSQIYACVSSCWIYYRFIVTTCKYELILESPWTTLKNTNIWPWVITICIEQFTAYVILHIKFLFRCSSFFVFVSVC